MLRNTTFSLHRIRYMDIRWSLQPPPTLSRGRKALAVIGTAVAYVGVIMRRQKAVVRGDTTDSHAASASYRQQYGFHTILRALDPILFY